MEKRRQKRKEERVKEKIGRCGGEIRGADEEREVLVVQMNHKTFMFIENSQLQVLTKGVQTCQIGEAAGLLECV